ncbi:hypothetical protein MWR47_10100 [Staphylococcus hominis]|uniref:hypothetical protein n=1 Tax=Staphylococcus hominis TaxID=1290 RepID=UPI002DBDDCB4|nr:hypothetical protein [Staphylococcus hominis]MEB5576654.1 hypothetical protein [Staphylococcus hominis]
MQKLTVEETRKIEGGINWPERGIFGDSVYNTGRHVGAANKCWNDGKRGLDFVRCQQDTFNGK